MKSLACVHGLLLLSLLSMEGRGDTFADDAPPGDAVLIPDYPAGSRSTTAFNQKSYAAAYAWMLGATAIPIYAGSYMLSSSHHEQGEEIGAALILGGILIGPSAGQYYAGAPGPATGALVLRLAGGGLVLIGLIKAFSNCFWESSSCNSGSGEALLGTVLFASGSAYSLIDTKFAVDRYNRRERERAAVRTSFSPALFPVGEGSNRSYAPGLAFTASF